MGLILINKGSSKVIALPNHWRTGYEGFGKRSFDSSHLYGDLHCLAAHQLRGHPAPVAEGLTVLPILYKEAIPGIFIGVLLANIFGGLGLADIVVGSLTSLVAAYLTYRFRRSFLAYLSPILLECRDHQHLPACFGKAALLGNGTKHRHQPDHCNFCPGIPSGAFFAEV